MPVNVLLRSTAVSDELLAVLPEAGPLVDLDADPEATIAGPGEWVVIGRVGPLIRFGRDLGPQASAVRRVLAEGNAPTRTAMRLLEVTFPDATIGVVERGLDGAWASVAVDLEAPLRALSSRAHPVVDVRGRGGDRLALDELHAVLAALDPFDYAGELRDEGAELTLVPAPGADVDELRRAFESRIAPRFENLRITVVEPLADVGRRRFVDRRTRGRGVVRALWAGDAGSEARAAAEVCAAERGDKHARLLPGDDAREPVLLVSNTAEGLDLAVALFDRGVVGPGWADVVLQGVSLRPHSRLALARAPGESIGAAPWVDPSRCVGSGDCATICPTRAIALVNGRPRIDAEACIQCQLCVERCDVEALRPVFAGESIDGGTVQRNGARLAATRQRHRPRALTGKLGAPASVRRKRTVVLGLATVTLMEHAAALLIDGELVAAVEEERLVRERHYTWRHPERPGTSLASDPCLTLEEAWPNNAIRSVLALAGLTMDDVDVVGVNGIPARLRDSFAGGRRWRPPPVMRAAGIVFVPHHLAHAASAYGMSDFDDAWILSVDGRGDYETATIWRAEGHALSIVDAVPWLPDRSFGGVYETITRVLGFGTHGQGSTMALAALGEPTIDLADCLGIDARGRVVLSEWKAERRFDPLTRAHDEPITDVHRDLAASAQLALETVVGDYLERHVGSSLAGQNLGMCGGVALNCKMNGVLRRRFQPDGFCVQPAANDAGTAIGAALIAHRELTGELPRLNPGHTHLGPRWSDDAIADSLRRMRLPFERPVDLAGSVAGRIAAGQIVCWFQGPMEFGPRALGGRSILADPRREEIKPRLNRMKGRQPWRPFGSSVLAGSQGEWFEEDWDSRFMLFAVTVRPQMRARVPVIVHDDGTSRPQIVHAEHHARYHAMIAAFERRTGVPMVVNTSFNRGGEAIVCTPPQALESFVGLGADAIVLGDCVVSRSQLRRRR